MALLVTGSLANVYAALDTYLTEQLVTNAGLVVRLHGVRRFIPPVDDPWIEAHYDFLGLHSQFLRQTGGELPNVRRPGYDESVYGTERRGYLQLNVFQRARVFATRYLSVTARDTVVGVFADGAIIPVYDVADVQMPLVGNVIIDGVPSEHVIDTAYHSAVTQFVIQIATRYIERYTRG